MTTVDLILIELRNCSTELHLEKMKHFGINNSRAYGVRIPDIRKLAKLIGKNHPLALELWQTQVHEARILASMIALPNLLCESDFDSWVNDFDSWDLCDVCCDLLWKCSFVNDKIKEYAESNKEFVKRTAFVLMCDFAVTDKKKPDDEFEQFFQLIQIHAYDDRNFVKKAVNWALRQIGKRNEFLRLRALEVAETIYEQPFKSSRWIASDARRELMSDKTIQYVNRKKLK